MSRKPQSHVRILIYRTWAIISTCLTLNLVHPVFLSFLSFFFFLILLKSRILSFYEEQFLYLNTSKKWP